MINAQVPPSLGQGPFAPAAASAARIERQDVRGETIPRGGTLGRHVVDAALRHTGFVEHSSSDPGRALGYGRGRRRDDELILDHSKFLTIAAQIKDTPKEIAAGRRTPV